MLGNYAGKGVDVRASTSMGKVSWPRFGESSLLWLLIWARIWLLLFSGKDMLWNEPAAIRKGALAGLSGVPY